MNLEEKQRKNLHEGFFKLRIHPALDFTKDKCYLGIFLPVREKDLERDTLCILTDERELFPATKEELDKRLLSLKYKPIYFQRRISLECIKAFLAGRTVRPEIVFEEIKRELERYIEFPSDNVCEYFAIWIIGTYLHPLFRVYPYIHLSGPKGCGKTKTLMLVNCLAFNSMFSESISTPSIYRSIRGSRCTLLIDETERFTNPERAKKFRVVLLSGYEQRTNVYSPKIMVNAHWFANVLESRSVKFVMRRTTNKEIWGREVDIIDERWQELRDGLYLLMLNHWKEIAKIYQSLANESELTNGEWELWKPILAIGRFLSKKLYEKMFSFAEEKSKEKKECRGRALNPRPLGFSAPISL